MKFESQLAESVFKSKYLLEGETTPEEAVERIVKAVAKVYPEIEEEAREYINKQWFIPAGGVWRGAGNSSKNVSHINCTNLGHVEDNLESIFNSLYKWAKFAAYGQGEGIDISHLRPKGSAVHNSSRTSTGAVSFMSLYDAVLKVIAQQGRRGASLISIIDHHPDIEDFIAIKDKPETDKSRIDTANISIQVTDAFMKAVEEDSDWLLHYENKYERIEKVVKARELFEKICHMAWKRGDPGLQFLSTWQKYSNSDPLGYPLEASNACFGGKEKLLTKNGYFSFEELNGNSVDILSDDGKYYNGKVFSSGKKETVALKLSTGKNIIVTPDQIVKTTEGEFEAKDTLGKTILTFNDKYELEYDEKWVKLGFIQGDGSIGRLLDNKHKGFEIYIGDKDTDIKDLFIKELEGVNYQQEKRSYYVNNSELNDSLYKYEFDFSPLPVRTLPKNLPEDKELSFLMGLFSANGYVTKNYRVGLKATSRKLIDQVCELLNKYGINHYVTTNKKKNVLFRNGNYEVKESYDINIGTVEGLTKYYYLIGFYHDYKQEALKELLYKKSPKVLSIKQKGIQEVYDFQLPSNHWGFVNNLVVHNCGEIPGDVHNVCMLSHINLAKYKEFGHDGFVKLIKFGIKFLNACRFNEINEGRSPIPEQLEKINLIPRIGLGDTGFADYLLDKQIPYSSSEALEERKYIGQTMAKYAYETGYELAKRYGSFPAYDKESMKKSAYIQRLLQEQVISDNILDYQFNVQYLTCAPVGTGTIIANTGGSGIEPLFSRYMVRRERSTTKDWKEWFTFNAYVERYLKEQGLEVTKENADKLNDPWWVMSFDVDPIAKVKLVAEAQKWIDSSISVTFNLPEDATVEDVKNVYMEAWHHNLKGVTVYREGSLGGVLITEKSYNKQQKEQQKEVKRDDGYERRPHSLDCDIYEAKYKDHKFVVLVGLKDNEPYEVFITPNDEGLIDIEKNRKGKIIKVKSGHYDLVVENGVVKTMINNIGKQFDSIYGTLSRMVSMSIRHKVPLQFIVDQLNKDSSFIAFEKVLSRILKKYIKDNTSTKKKCPTCGSELIYQDGCISCSNSECGYSKCD